MEFTSPEISAGFAQVHWASRRELNVAGEGERGQKPGGGRGRLVVRVKACWLLIFPDVVVSNPLLHINSQIIIPMG